MDCVHTDDLLRIYRTHDPPGLSLVGQVDLTNQGALVRQLIALNGVRADLTVDLTEVTFVNFPGLHALVAFAHSLPPGRRLLLHTRTLLIGQMLTLCGWDELPCLRLTLIEEFPDA